jgi:hypothetical protein
MTACCCPARRAGRNARLEVDGRIRSERAPPPLRAYDAGGLRPIAPRTRLSWSRTVARFNAFGFSVNPVSPISRPAQTPSTCRRSWVLPPTDAPLILGFRLSVVLMLYTLARFNAFTFSINRAFLIPRFLVRRRSKWGSPSLLPIRLFSRYPDCVL